MSGMGDVFEALGELDANNVGSWPSWAHIGGIMIVAAAILGGGAWHFVLPKQETLQHIQQHEQKLRQHFTRKHKQVARLDDYKKQLAILQKRFEKQLKQFSQQTEIPGLLNDISQVRLASGLTEKLFKPRAPITTDFYIVRPNVMTVTGKYHELATFVSGVTSLPRIVTIDSVKIEPVGTAGGGMLRMNITINTYQYIGSHQ